MTLTWQVWEKLTRWQHMACSALQKPPGGIWAGIWDYQPKCYTMAQ
jgi:hypothetical protein